MTQSTRHNGRILRRVALASLFFIPALLLGCTKNSGSKGPTGPNAAVTGTASNGLATASINFNPNTVAPGGNAGITLLLTTLSGAPIADQSVQWSTTGGTLATVSGKTDAAGKAVNNISIPETSTSSSEVATAVVANLTVKGTLFIGVPGTLKIDPPGPLTLAPGDTQFLNCVGGVDPVRWEPSGGTLNRTNDRSVIFTAGSLTGTFFEKCTDAANNSASVSITIGTAQTLLTVTPTSVTLSPNQTQNFTASGGRPPYTWSFPAGAIVITSPSSITLTAGTTSGTFTLILTDSVGATASAAVTIAVPPLTLLPTTVTRQFGTSCSTTNCVPPPCSVSAAITLTVTGGVPPYTFSATFGTVTPSTLSAAGTVTYSFTGTLTAGTTNTETVTVLDSVGKSATSTVTFSCVKQ